MNRTVFLLLLMILTLLILPVASAQEDECSEIVEAALSSTSEECGSIEHGELCYGYGAIEAVVNCDSAPTFDTPGDILPLDVICSIRLAAFDPAGTWGVAAMRVPVDMSGLDATYVLMGEVQIQNASSSFFELEAELIRDTEIHNGPGSHYEVVGSFVTGEMITANACNCTGNWLRVRLETGGIGWISARSVNVMGDVGTLPGVQADTPVYQSMQAFRFQSGGSDTSCAGAPESGILIQVPADMPEAHLQINAVEVVATSTIFVQSEPGGDLTVEVLDGLVNITIDNFTATVPAGGRAVVPMTDDSVVAGMPRIEAYVAEDVVNLPLNLLTREVDPLAPLVSEIPVIVGVETCAVIAGREATICPLHYLNPDGDAIVRMDVEFVSAPQGEWEGSIRQPPELIGGDHVSGVLAWDSTCSLGRSNCFIGPIKWSITITDEAGHTSAPFEAQFNCVEG